VYQEDWDVVGATYSKSGRYLTVQVNQDALAVLRVLDARPFHPRRSAGWAGSIHAFSIARDDSAVAFYATDGSVPD